MEVVTTAPVRTRRWLPRASLVLVALGTLSFAAGARAAGPEVIVLPTTGIVDHTMAKYLADSIAQANDRHASAVVIKLNTPGGELEATNDIVGTILEAPLPVIVWVAPAGGFAASAGTFITLSANIAVMAPGTRIGAASPISSDGTDIGGTLGKKVLEDAIADIKEIATVRSRNVDWAIQAVRDAKSSPASEAVELHVVDGLAASLDEVLAFADGKTVRVGGHDVTLELAGAVTSEIGLNPFLAIFRLLSDPSIALLLLSLGSTGIIAELWSPNFVTGILGALMIILALIGLGTLPLNVGGLVLIIFAFVLFGLEVTVTSHGLLGFGGVVCFVLGASALFSGPVDPFGPVLQVAPAVITAIAATGGVFAFVIGFGVLRSRRAGIGVTVGSTVAAGVLAEVRSPLRPLGSVLANGEEWSARTADGQPLERGTHVRVTRVDGLTLTVEPDASSSKGA